MLSFIVLNTPVGHTNSSIAYWQPKNLFRYVYKIKALTKINLELIFINSSIIDYLCLEKIVYLGRKQQ